MLFTRYSEQIPGYGAAVIGMHLDIDIVIYFIFFLCRYRKIASKNNPFDTALFRREKNKKYLQMIIKINIQIKIKMKANFSADFLYKNLFNILVLIQSYIYEWN